MAHRIVWASAATVDRHGRPRSRVLHPIWLWDGTELSGWIATVPTPIKRGDLEGQARLGPLQERPRARRLRSGDHPGMEGRPPFPDVRGPAARAVPPSGHARLAPA